MILDRNEQIAHYESVWPGLGGLAATALAPAFLSASDGRHDLGGGAYAILQTYTTRPLAEGFWEAHRRFIDVQCVLTGAETCGWTPLADCRLEEWNEARDLARLAGPDPAGHGFSLRPGLFAVFFPWDAHMPSLHPAGAPAPVRKLVLKLPVRASA